MKVIATVHGMSFHLPVLGITSTQSSPSPKSFESKVMTKVKNLKGECVGDYSTFSNQACKVAVKIKKEFHEMIFLALVTFST